MALNLKARHMIPIRDKAEGQALIEFATNLIISLFITFIKYDRLFHNWTVSQNPASASGPLSLTGQFETEFLFEFPVYIYTRANSLRDEALSYAAGLNSGHYLSRGAIFFISQSRDLLLTPITVAIESQARIVNITYAKLSKQRLYCSVQQNIAFAGRSSVDCAHLKAKP
jgi:hypothetical protein